MSFKDTPYNPPASGHGGFPRDPNAPKMVALRSIAWNAAETGQCATSARPHEQTVGDFLVEMRDTHQEQYRKHRDAILSTPEAVLRMTVAQFRQLANLL